MDVLDWAESAKTNARIFKRGLRRKEDRKRGRERYRKSFLSVLPAHDIVLTLPLWQSLELETEAVVGLPKTNTSFRSEPNLNDSDGDGDGDGRYLARKNNVHRTNTKQAEETNTDKLKHAL